MQTNIILEFPNFLPVEQNMKDEIVSIISKYPAYHDYSLGNIFCWDTDHSLQLCTLNNNLVIQFPDYLDDSKHYLSFLGDSELEDTTEKLIEYSKTKLDQSFLRYVPEVSTSQEFNLEPVRDDFDYVFDTRKYLNFDGHILSKIKSEYSQFVKKNEQNLSVKSYTALDVDWQIIRDIFSVWLSSKPSPELFDQEKIAIENMASMPKDFLNLWIMVTYILDQPVGFSIYELRDDWAICHFAKADMSFSHIFNFVFIESFRKITEQGVSHVNLEPDLGIEGLRISKERKQPSGFLKKYKVSLK